MSITESQGELTMLRYLYADQLHVHSRLADEMFTHRADQFGTRLGWDVNVDAYGHERDKYDALTRFMSFGKRRKGDTGGQPVSCRPRGLSW